MANPDDLSQISELEAVDLKEVWPNEAGDFTPWLAKRGNLESLGEILGLELELEGTEESVGDFKADIVCTADGGESKVLIENQLADTDHRHLGQTLTYAAGLNAVTVIWIARKFRDEHRAAIDWLNEITNERFSFFGMEVKLWKIDGSRPAHQFSIVSRPNDWTTNISQTTGGETSTSNLQHQHFWTQLSKELKVAEANIKPRRSFARSWAHYSIGRSSFGLRASRSNQKGQIQVALRMFGSDSHAHYKLLELEKTDIVKKLGRGTEWIERQAGKECLVRTSKTGVTTDDEDDWPN